MQHRISLSTVTLLAIAAAKSKKQSGVQKDEQEVCLGTCVVNNEGAFIDSSCAEEACTCC